MKTNPAKWNSCTNTVRLVFVCVCVRLLVSNVMRDFDLATLMMYRDRRPTLDAQQ